ncbi:MAG: oxaloacetate decarboxylase subunit alpha [Thermotoga sp.]|nr:MAG: oxaloacetate decarboxylase subunit alpha [Thermotoga sp.]
MFVDTTLRDAQQSLIATRMRTEDMEPVLDAFDELGFHAMEVWGGATYDSMVRFLDEDPWERLKTVRSKLKRTKIQMLLRGQNLVGYRIYADDVVELFIKKVADYGLDIVRIFDALNDVRNMSKPIEVSKRFGLHVQGAISYTVSPFHTIDYYIDYVEKLIDAGVDSICIKDMAGILTPKIAYELVKLIKKRFGVSVDIHSHCTSGLAPMVYLASLEAGADWFDTALSPFSDGTSQPPYETLHSAFIEYRRMEPMKTGTLRFLVDHFSRLREKYREYDVGRKYPDTMVFIHQIPGGMYSNLVRQMAEQGMMDKLEDVLKEVPRVRKDLGYPPLVTPISQIVGVQALLNVLHGRYRIVTNELKRYVKGLYGKPPVKLDPEFVDMILEGEKPVDVRPADLLSPELREAKRRGGMLVEREEDLLTFVILGKVGEPFLRRKYEKNLRIDFEYVDDMMKFTGDVPVYPI